MKLEQSGCRLPQPQDNASLCTTDSSLKRRRNGKIARLPKKLRDLINELLSDGLTYANIIQRLKEPADPPLPYDITEKNLSTWHTGGFQEWERHQERMELIAAKLDFAIDLAQSSQPDKLQELSLQLAAVRVCEFLSELAIADPQTDPVIYLRLLSALPRITKESLNLQKYRDTTATAEMGRAISPKAPTSPVLDEDRTEALRAAFLDKMDDIMGLKSYRHSNPDSQSAPSQSVTLPTPATPKPPTTPELHPDETLNSNPAGKNGATIESEHPEFATNDTELPNPAPPTDTCGNLQTPETSLSAFPSHVPQITPDEPGEDGPSITNQNSKLKNPTETPPEPCPICDRLLPPLLSSGERPYNWCDHCGTSLPPPPPS